MKLEQFAMERMQSTYENLVEFNLSESGVRPLTPRELIEDAAGLEGLLDQPLVYSQSNGTIELRRLIAAMYPGAGIDHIEVTNGGSEANFITTFNLIEPADEVVMLGGHLDSWHAGTGATDNAIGCAVMMEAARILVATGAKPRSATPTTATPTG